MNAVKLLVVGSQLFVVSSQLFVVRCQQSVVRCHEILVIPITHYPLQKCKFNSASLILLMSGFG
ncbi:MAG: hypothetical protein ACKOQS_13310 [Dolichospermum sp.]